MTATLVDVNVVFAILVVGHAHHQPAWRWWERQLDDSVVSCLLTRLGVLRLLTNSNAMAGSPVTPEKALESWDLFSNDPRCTWKDPDSRHEAPFRSFVAGRQASPNLWTDAWLAALAESQRLRLASFDGDFHSFRLKDFDHLR